MLGLLLLLLLPLGVLDRLVVGPVDAAGAPMILRGAWLARLARCYAHADPALALAACTPGLTRYAAQQLELDLLAVMCSDANLCFGCYLPLSLRGAGLAKLDAHSSAHDPEWKALFEARGVAKQPVAEASHKDWREMDHAACDVRPYAPAMELERRRGRGRALLAQMARIPAP